MYKKHPLGLYNITENYIKYLFKYDNRIMISVGNKATRPFVGIVLQVNNTYYFAPLASPKPKHLKMKNSIDFLKIKGGEYGAINFNNMIPAPTAQMTLINYKDITDIAYSNLLQNQYIWCNDNKDRIFKIANKLYFLSLERRIPQNIKKRCVNFKLLEEKCLEYQSYLQSIEEVAVTKETEDKDIEKENKDDWEIER